MSRVRKVFSSVLGVDESAVVPTLSPDNTPTWDSLNAIILVSELENAFNIKFSYDEVMAVTDVAGAIALIRSKGGNVEE